LNKSKIQNFTYNSEQSVTSIMRIVMSNSMYINAMDDTR